MDDPEIHYSVTPFYHVLPSDEALESDMFEFDVAIMFTHMIDQDMDDDYDPYSDFVDYLSAQISCTEWQDTFMVERRADDESFRANVKRRLEVLGVPASVHPYLVDILLDEAKSMESERGFLGRKVIRMSLSFDVIVEYYEEAALNLDRDDDFVDARMVPASKSSMANLERVNVEESSNIQCSICFEEISEATRLPCSHVYHGQCIRNWLERSGKCPLCRFVI